MAKKKYESDKGSIHQISLSSEKAAVANNTEPAGSVDSNIKPKISKSNREYGLRPRGVRLVKELTATQGNVTVTKNVYAFLPILKPDTLTGANFTEGKDVTYKGDTWKVLAQVQEDY